MSRQVDRSALLDARRDRLPLAGRAGGSHRNASFRRRLRPRGAPRLSQRPGRGAERVQRAVQDADAGQCAPGSVCPFLRQDRDDDADRLASDRRCDGSDLAHADGRAARRTERADRRAAEHHDRRSGPCRVRQRQQLDGAADAQRTVGSGPCIAKRLGRLAHLCPARGRTHRLRLRPSAFRHGADADRARLAQAGESDHRVHGRAFDHLDLRDARTG